MIEDYASTTKTIVQYALLTGAKLEQITKNYLRSDYECVFPNLSDANCIKGSLERSFKRYLKSTQHCAVSNIRYGNKGNKILWEPLPQDFDISNYLIRKPNVKGYELPKWTEDVYKSQFGDVEAETYFNDCTANNTFNNEGNEAVPPPLPRPNGFTFNGGAVPPAAAAARPNGFTFNGGAVPPAAAARPNGFTFNGGAADGFICADAGFGERKSE
jgi:hypothetical protein